MCIDLRITREVRFSRAGLDRKTLRMDGWNKEWRGKCGVPGVRYIFTGMGFLGFCIIYCLRVNINVAIVAMVNATAVYTNASTLHECQAPVKFNVTDNVAKEGEFDWTPKLQGFILGAFYYGYCVSQIPGGRLAEVLGGKWVFGLGTFISAVLTLLTPMAARWHTGFLITVRVLEGLAQGVTMPAMHSMLGRWLPECEKGLLSTVVYVGINIGTVVAMPVSGLLCNSDLFGGWPSAFYVFGIAGCIWFLLWIFLISDSPIDHPWITEQELKYITDNQKIQHFKKLPSIPWTLIMTSVPFWALIITQFGQDWCFYTLVTDLPTFLGTVLHFELEKNGLLSSMPYLFQTGVGCLVGYVTDMCIRRKCLSTNFVRKFCNTTACVGTAVGLVGVCLAGCNINLTIIFFTFAVAIGGFCYCGYMLSHLDLSPEYAGTLMGISNTISNLTGFIAPAVVGGLTEHYQTLHQWRIVFYITVGIILATCVVFLAFASTKKQDWAPLSAEHTIIKNEDDVTSDNFYGSVQKSLLINSVD